MSEWLAFFSSKAPLLMYKLWQQIYLTGGAVVIAILISIPLGIWISKKNKVKTGVLAFCSIFQTLPSLAVLGFLLPFLGIGIKTAIVTLVLYAILPILRNTVTAMENVPFDLLEAADGLGFTPWQKLKIVEIPLALPVMVAGIRTATSMSVGIATLAAFIGAGGLGDFIYEGLSLNNTALILLGAVPAAILALILDFAIGRVEHALVRKQDTAKPNNASVAKRIIFFMLFLILGTGIAFYSFNQFVGKKIIIGTKNFTEQLILGEIIAQLLEANTSLKVVRKFNLGGTFVAHHALVNGDIDLYPEYTGTAYTVILGQTARKNPQQIFNFLQSEYLKKFDVIWLAAFGFNNTNALAVRKDFAEKYSITSISGLKKIAKQLIIGVPADFMERPDGFVGLKNIYQLSFDSVKLMDIGLMYKAISFNEINVIMAFSTDGRLPAYDLVLLQDDLNLFPAYWAAPIIRREFLQKNPELSVILKRLAGKINNEVMQNLNYQVDEKKFTPETVARKFLVSHQLIK